MKKIPWNKSSQNAEAESSRTVVKKAEKAGSQAALKETNKNALRGGSYSLIAIAIVLAILVVVNVMASALPSNLTKFDISSSRLYSITSDTKAVVNALDKDCTIYWIVQDGEEDDVIENLLSKYESLSDHIKVEKKNPDVYPTFAEQYTDEDVANNSLVVVCGEKNRYISYDTIYQQTADYTTGSYDTSFDGEGQITSALNYVVSEDLPKIYTLQGHGESDLPTEFSDQIQKENYETDTLSLLKTDEVPDDADCILIYGPTSDISKKEKKILADYVANGGRLLVMAGPTQEDGILTNLYSLLSDYGVTANEGIVIEGDSDYYAFQQPYILMPNISSSTITDPLIDENYNVLMPISIGLTVNGSSEADVTSLLLTSDESFSKVAGYKLTTYDKEDGDIDGSFALGVSVETLTDGQIIWYTSSQFLEDTYNSYSSGANLDLAMNSLSALVGNNDSIAIRSKSMSYNYLTISDSTSVMLQTLMIGILPAAFIVVGIVLIVRRRKRNEAL